MIERRRWLVAIRAALQRSRGVALLARRPLPALFLILGSPPPELLRQSSETLAGRLETVTLTGLGVEELGAEALMRHWRRGGFPPAYLAHSDEASLARRRPL